MSLGTFILLRAHNETEPQSATFSQVGDNSYPTGGTATFQTYLGERLKNLPTIQSCRGLDTTGAYQAQFNAITGKLQVFVVATGAEVANAVDLSGYTFLLDAVYN